MAWEVFGEWYTTADMSGTPRVFMPVKFNRNVILRAMRTWVIAYNDPSFTSLEMRIYSNQGNAPVKLLHTSSNVITKAQMMTEANAVKEIYFEWDSLPSFKGTDTYHFVLHANGYTGDSSSHLAWRKAIPDPVYTTGLETGDLASFGAYPYFCAFIGADYDVF